MYYSHGTREIIQFRKCPRERVLNRPNGAGQHQTLISVLFKFRLPKHSCKSTKRSPTANLSRIPQFRGLRRVSFRFWGCDFGSSWNYGKWFIPFFRGCVWMGSLGNDFKFGFFVDVNVGMHLNFLLLLLLLFFFFFFFFFF